MQCIHELRAKALHFQRSCIIPTLDTENLCIAKSDTVVKPTLHDELVAAFAQLGADQASAVDWQPRSGDMVQNLVHPSMYPFVYGKRAMSA